MVDFGGFDTRYFNAMDREYIGNELVKGPVNSAHTGHNCDHHHDTNDVNVKAGDLGMSFGLGPVPNMPAILGKLRAGSKQVELGFMGMGKGSGQGHTAGMYGKKQRQALRESAAANRLDFTTHTSVGVFGLAGQDRGGNFSREQKITSLQEIKRAIEFASDVGLGGPVVVHTGEFNRPFSETDWNEKGKWKGKFESFPGDEKRSQFFVVDKRSGQSLAPVTKGKTVTKAKYMRYNNERGGDIWEEHKGKEYVDEKGQVVKEGSYIDYLGNKVEKTNAVPIYDKDTGRFETEQVGWSQLKEEAETLTKEAKEFFRKNKNAPESVWDNSIWRRFKDALNEKEIEVLPEEAFVITTLQTNAADARGFAMQYLDRFERTQEEIKQLKEGVKKAQEDGNSDAVKSLKEQINDRGDALKRIRDVASSGFTRAAETEETIKHVESARRYALEESYDSYGRAGVYALRKSEELEKKNQLKRPIMVAMENLFPESYGAHPEEIMKILRGSRGAMAKMLIKDRGWSEEKAMKKAQDHISITLDVGHLNMWRKYWKQDPKKSVEQNDKDYNVWMVDMVKKMSKENMVGHVHLDDNYGYNDVHLAPGEGNAPIVEMVKAIKENTPGGYKGDLIVEPGADFTTDTGGFQSVMKAWKLFGSPISGAMSASSMQKERTWGSIQYSHFGQNAPPNFTFQPYSPSEDWTLWSGVPFE